MTTHTSHAAELLATARAICDHDPGDPIARAAAELLATVARTLTTADPATLFDYAPTAGAALNLADAYRDRLDGK